MHPSSGRRDANHSCCSDIVADGMDRIPPFFCAATETLRDVATKYAETKLNLLTLHKFEKFVAGALEYQALPEAGINPIGFAYMVEVYVDDFVNLVIPVS